MERVGSDYLTRKSWRDSVTEHSEILKKAPGRNESLTPPSPWDWDVGENIWPCGRESWISWIPNPISWSASCRLHFAHRFLYFVPAWFLPCTSRKHIEPSTWFRPPCLSFPILNFEGGKQKLKIPNPYGILGKPQNVKPTLGSLSEELRLRDCLVKRTSSR